MNIEQRARKANEALEHQRFYQHPDGFEPFRVSELLDKELVKGFLVVNSISETVRIYKNESDANKEYKEITEVQKKRFETLDEAERKQLLNDFKKKWSNIKLQ